MVSLNCCSNHDFVRFFCAVRLFYDWWKIAFRDFEVSMLTCCIECITKVVEESGVSPPKAFHDERVGKSFSVEKIYSSCPDKMGWPQLWVFMQSFDVENSGRSKAKVLSDQRVRCHWWNSQRDLPFFVWNLRQKYVVDMDWRVSDRYTTLDYLEVYPGGV